MEKPNSWIAHVEAFVDSARATNQQVALSSLFAASVDAIAVLVHKDLLTLEGLVIEMEQYLTTSDHVIRARGILLLAEVLSHLLEKPLDSRTVSSLVEFFTSKLEDWQALHGALIGCLALLKRTKKFGMVESNDAKSLAESFLRNVQVQSLAVRDRKLCFEVIQRLLDVYPQAVVELGDDLVYGICEAIDEEKDPRCLMLTFSLVGTLGRLFPDPSGPLGNFSSDVFDILSRYFPIYFTHPKGDGLDITRDDLSKALMDAFSSSPLFEPFVIPLLLEKLSSSLPSAKLDSLKYLNSCMPHYGADKVVKHSQVIWSNLKDVIFNLSPHRSSLSTYGSDGDMDSELMHVILIFVSILSYAVKGLQVLATFPEIYSPVSEATYEDILVMLMSIITRRNKETYLWELSLKALVQIGLWIENAHDSAKAISYNKLVIQRIVSMLQPNDSTISLSLKLVAISEISSIDLYLLTIVQAFEEAIVSNLRACFEGNLKSSGVLVPLLQCYSNQVLPRCHTCGNFNDIAVQVAVSIWNQIEYVAVFRSAILMKDVLDQVMMTMKHLVAGCTEENQFLILQKACSSLPKTFLIAESLPCALSQLEGFQCIQDTTLMSCRDEWVFSLFGSVVIALRPQTPLVNVKILLNLFVVLLLKGNMPAAQALASMVNKWPADVNKSEVSYSLDQAIEEILKSCLWTSESSSNFIDRDSCFQKYVVLGLAWIGKGLLMRGHEKLKEIAMLLLKCLVAGKNVDITLFQQHENGSKDVGQDASSHLATFAADAFHVLLSDSEDCLNKKFHATIRPLYKQRFFSSMLPILLSSIKESDPSSKTVVLYRAFGHVISDTPLAAVVGEAKKIVPTLADALAMLSLDILNKDMIYSLLLVVSGILMDDNGKAIVLENVHTIISLLIKLISYPHLMIVRETAIQCLVAISALPYARIYPYRPQVFRAVSTALDDRKRVVRQEAVRCRQAWSGWIP
ncbi:Dos2-interacting transcription regulator of RNA-Pol-II [Musa troglodytarum]|uniref:MMS19 nucleotide excision repair protein n=1 Tax=Musa troglodytarum TaxID=320322 RepID=A0A9E7I370_9LILI|nr:Dos2-interacting transcription regulator of RNA-Pol-II [Musa troglodytarum]